MFEVFRTMEAIMQAWQLEGVGIENFRLVEKAVPEPGRGGILIRAKAVSLNYRDWDIVAGTYPLKVELPLVLGSDVAGEIVAIGPAVAEFQVGDRVTGLFRPEWQGGVPTAGIRPASLVAPLPDV